MKSLLKALCILIAPWFLTGCGSKNVPHLPTVATVDPARYQGQWFEIARYENRFEKGCVGASAEYVLENETILVTNRCYDESGTEINEAKGKAFVVDGSNGSRLRVSFFWPFYGDYWILMLPDDYRYSVVGTPDRKYLWILSRTQHLSAADRDKILSNLPQLGFLPERLYWTRFKSQAANET